MKKKILSCLILLSALFTNVEKIKAMPVDFKDENFYKCVVESYKIENETNYGYEVNLTDEQLGFIRRINCSFDEQGDITGFSKLVNIEYADFYHVNNTTIDLSKNKKLRWLTATNGKLENLDLSNNVELTHLQLHNNKLKIIDVSKNLKLQHLNLYGNSITEIDVTKNKELKELTVHGSFEKIDLSNNQKLTNLALNGNIKYLDLDKNIELTTLWLGFNELSDINLSNNTKLVDIDLSFNELSKLDLSKNINLQRLKIYGNNLIENSFEIPNTIKSLGIFGNEVSLFDLRKFKNLEKLYVTSLTGETIILNSGKELSSYFESNVFVETSDENVVSISGNKFKTIKEGTATIKLDDGKELKIIVKDDKTTSESDEEQKAISTTTETTITTEAPVSNPKTNDINTLLVGVGTILLGLGIIISVKKIKKLSK